MQRISSKQQCSQSNTIRNSVIVGTALLAGSVLYYSPDTINSLKSLISYAITSPTIISASGCFMVAGLIGLMEKFDKNDRNNFNPILAIIIRGSAFFCVGYIGYLLISLAITYVPYIINGLLSVITYAISSPLYLTLCSYFSGLLFVSSEMKNTNREGVLMYIGGGTLFYLCYLLSVLFFDTSAANVERFLNSSFSPFLSRIIMFVIYYLGLIISWKAVLQPFEMPQFFINSILELRERLK